MIPSYCLPIDSEDSLNYKFLDLLRYLMHTTQASISKHILLLRYPHSRELDQDKFECIDEYYYQHSIHQSSLRDLRTDL